MERWQQIFVVTLLSSTLCINTTATPTIETGTFKPEISKSEMDRWQEMVGKWYGLKNIGNGGIRHQLMNRRADGTYIIELLIENKDGNNRYQAEVGHWGISGPIYFTIFRGWIEDGEISPSSPYDPYNYDAYEIINQNENIFQYRHFSTGNEYTIKKVSAEFKLPVKDKRQLNISSE
ncbi:hypothetical protein [Candidatus Reidiella endopervernicosa]|uniref:Uncharacterized protein n=1 Tax=Candidatus Reidiella endopervernicosa TaxID=2738883 RepID=A0A6N0HX04_9GAMM|nr:hypothetical protein [Candidatus Reidiella endopervernicosa]QKQ26781.1 hypothetical protein HUE57_11165 [Candidatus Reidiella endopervernicosa]